LMEGLTAIQQSHQTPGVQQKLTGHGAIF